MKTITGKFQDEQGNGIANGILRLRLSQPANVSGTAQIVPQEIIITLDATGAIPAATQIFANDELTPTGTTYYASLSSTVKDASGTYVDAGSIWQQQWSIVGTSPIDLTTLVPATSSVSTVTPITSVALVMPGELTVTGSPLTANGTITVGKANESANTVWSGPTTGAAAAPTFRALVDADIPTTLTNHAIVTPTLTNPKLAASSTIQNSTGATSMGATLKKGSGGGDYTTTSATYVDVDATNLSYTVTVPTGWKLVVNASGYAYSATAAVTVYVSLFDSATLAEVAMGATTSTTAYAPWALNWVITGDGNSHTVKLQFKTSNAADAAKIGNFSSTLLPQMVCTLMPSN